MGITALSVHQTPPTMTTRYSITTERYGYEHFNAYSDITLVGNLETAAISRIVVESGPYINSLTVGRFHLKR